MGRRNVLCPIVTFYEPLQGSIAKCNLPLPYRSLQRAIAAFLAFRQGETPHRAFRPLGESVGELGSLIRTRRCRHLPVASRGPAGKPGRRSISGSPAGTRHFVNAVATSSPCRTQTAGIGKEAAAVRTRMPAAVRLYLLSGDWVGMRSARI